MISIQVENRHNVASSGSQANTGHETRALQAYLRHKKHPAHRALHRVVADAVQGFLARLTADAGATT
jgi:hypothetical protein